MHEDTFDAGSLAGIDLRVHGPYVHRHGCLLCIVTATEPAVHEACLPVHLA